MTNIRFDYHQCADYSPEYVNGCYGGKTPKGEVVLNFFKEGFSIPESEVYRLTDDGELGERVSIIPEDAPFVRTISCGVIMSEKSAREIYEWLGHILNG